VKIFDSGALSVEYSRKRAHTGGAAPLAPHIRLKEPYGAGAGLDWVGLAARIVGRAPFASAACESSTRARTQGDVRAAPSAPPAWPVLFLVLLPVRSPQHLQFQAIITRKRATPGEALAIAHRYE
jgi:hypothetical protein